MEEDSERNGLDCNTWKTVILPTITKPGTILLNMEFNYDIPVEEYAAAQALYYKAVHKGQHLKRALGWVFLGAFFVLIAVFRWVTDWQPILLLLTGAWFFYVAIGLLFPTRHFRKYYPESGLAGKNYHAEVDEHGFSVEGDGCSWRVPWTESRFRGEDERVFMFSGKGTIFIFGKKHLTHEQQNEIRQLAAMPRQLA